MLLHGILPPLTTPFYPDGSLYLKKLEHNVAHYSRTPIAGMVILGSNGETPLLSDAEQRHVLKTARGAAEPEKVLIAGVGHESVRHTIAMCEYAAELGYDACMARTPHYFKSQMQPPNMLAYYRTVADHSPLPVLIYSFPQCTGYDIPADIVVQLAEHPNIAGIKESSGNVDKVKELVARTRHIRRTATVTEVFAAATRRMLAAPARAAVTASDIISTAALTGIADAAATAVLAAPKLKMRTREVGFQVLVGSAQKLLASLQVGAVGAILAFADCAPTACYEIYAAWKEDDQPLAQEKQQRIVAAATRVVGELSIPGLKYAMDLNGYFGGPVRLPLLNITGDQKQEVERLMADLRN